MTKTKIKLLTKACRMAGIDASKIAPSNPFEKKGGTAATLQAAVSETHPQQALKYRVATDDGLSAAIPSELLLGGISTKKPIKKPKSL